MQTIKGVWIVAIATKDSEVVQLQLNGWEPFQVQPIDENNACFFFKKQRDINPGERVQFKANELIKEGWL